MAKTNVQNPDGTFSVIDPEAPAPIEAAPPTVPAPVPAQEAQPAVDPLVNKNEKVHMLSQHQFKKIKDEAGSKAVESLMRELGAANVEELKAKLKPPEPAPKPKVDKSSEKAWIREREELSAKAAKAEEQNRRLQLEIDAASTRALLERAAIHAGCKDVDVALVMLQQASRKMTDADRAAFDEKTWFADLKKARPYLFSELVTGATSGTGPNSAPNPQSAGASLKDSVAGKGFDARTATPQQFLERKAALGISASNARRVRGAPR
jgi:hypothetical protein